MALVGAADSCPFCFISLLFEEGIQYQRQECSGELFPALYYNYNIATIPICQITGGSSGIGKSLAIDAIKRGVASVTIVARNKVRGH